MRRPLLTVTLLYLTGILAGDSLAVPVFALLGVAYPLAVLALLCERLRWVALALLLPLAGWVSMAVSTSVIAPHDLRATVREPAQYVTIRGTLRQTPQLRQFERHGQLELRTQATVDVAQLGVEGAWTPASGAIAVTTPGVLGNDFYAGQCVQIAGVLQPPKGPAAEGLFDYRAYLRRQNIFFQLSAESPADWQLVRSPRGSDPARPYSDRFVTWAKNVLSRGLPRDETLGLLWAMTLGWKTALTDEVSAPFMQSGTLHIFAISGLHIALIAGILVSLLRVLQVSRAACGLIVIPALWFYTAATGWQSSAVRSTLMMTVVIAGWSLRRPADLVNSLAGAALIILVFEPQQLFQASFQLSFSVVLSIALLVPKLEALRQRLFQIDPLLPPELRPRWQRALDVPVRYLSANFSTSLAAWLGSIPLTAYYFHMITPVSLLANLLIVPLSGFALMSSLGSLSCGDWFPAAGELFNHSAWFWMRGMVVASEWSARLPNAFAYVAMPSMLQMAGYYIALGAVLSGAVFVSPKRLWIAAGLGLMAIACVAEHQYRTRGTPVRLTVLPIAGNTVFVDAPGRKDDLLIDCSNRAGAESVLAPFFQAKGVNRLPPLVLTHGDLRHVGGYEVLSQIFSAGPVFTSALPFRSAAYREIIQTLESQPERWRSIHRGDCVGSWKVLHPDAQDRFSRADDAAIVLQADLHGTRVLLLSDLGRSGQQKLLEREPDLRATIVISGIPTEGEPLADYFLQTVRPRLVILAGAAYPASARANSKLRERLARHNIPVVYTSDTAAASLNFEEAGWQLQLMNSSASPVTMLTNSTRDQIDPRIAAPDVVFEEMSK